MKILKILKIFEILNRDSTRFIDLQELVERYKSGYNIYDLKYILLHHESMGRVERGKSMNFRITKNGKEWYNEQIQRKKNS